MLIRHAQAADCSLLAELRWDLHQADNRAQQGDKAAFLENCCDFFHASLKTSLWTHFLATEADGIVAMASLYKVENIPTPARNPNRWFYLTNVYTIPEKRRQGIASKLIEHAYLQVVAQGGELCIVWPDEKQMALYNALGFKANPYLLQRISE